MSDWSLGKYGTEAKFRLVSRQTLIVHIKHFKFHIRCNFSHPLLLLPIFQNQFKFATFDKIKIHIWRILFHMFHLLLPLSRNVVNLRILIVILVCHNKRTAHFPKQSALSQCNAGSCKIKHPLHIKCLLFLTSNNKRKTKRTMKSCPHIKVNSNLATAQAPH